MTHYLMQFFDYEHLPKILQSVSEPFFHLANIINNELPDNPEKTVALRKLLEAKDCAVRSRIFKSAESSTVTRDTINRRVAQKVHGSLAVEPEGKVHGS